MILLIRKKVRKMHSYDKDIADMQCWVFRMAQVKWNISQRNVLLFLKNIIFWDLLLIAMIVCI